MPDKEVRLTELDNLRLAADQAGVGLPEIVLPRDSDVILRRMRFHYLDWGTVGRPTVLFLHGGGLTAHTWDVVCLALRMDFHCLALDQRGHGDSEWSPTLDYSTDTQAEDIAAFLDHLEADRLVIVGMSMGGLNGIRYAGAHTGRLVGLVLVDVGPDVQVSGAERIRQFTSTTVELKSIEEYVDRAMEFNPRRNPTLLRRSLLHNLRETPAGTLVWKYDQRHRYQRSAEEVLASQQTLWEFIPNITVPTLVVRGADSDVFYDEDAKKLAAKLPNGRWVRIPDAGHTVQGDNPGALLRELRPFLEEVTTK